MQWIAVFDWQLSKPMDYFLFKGVETHVSKHRDMVESAVTVFVGRKIKRVSVSDQRVPALVLTPERGCQIPEISVIGTGPPAGAQE